MGKKPKEIKLIKVTFTPKVFSAGQQTAWKRMWDELLAGTIEQPPKK